MIKILAIITLPLLLSSCSGPKTKSEAANWFRTSSMVKKSSYTIKSSNLKAIQQRMLLFKNKCLLKKVEYVSKRDTIFKKDEEGSVLYTSTFNVSILPSSNKVQFFIQRDLTDMVGAPEGGRYDFFAEAIKKGSIIEVFSSQLNVPMSGNQLSLGNMLKDFESWLKNKGQFCPQLS